MSKWAHYAHCKEILVKVGERVKKGQKIAILGGTGTDPNNTNNNKAPHLHFEIWRVDPRTKGYNYYPYGLSKAQVDAIYENPQPYTTKTVPTAYDHLGYGYLDKVQGANVFHPGLDINGAGQDLGNPEFACFDGVIQWIGTSVRGWGNHFYIKQEEIPTLPPIGDSMALQDIKIKDLPEVEFNKFHDIANSQYPGWTIEMYNKNQNAFQQYKDLFPNGTLLDMLNYMWGKPDYVKMRNELQKAKADLAACQAQGGSVDKAGINSLADQIKKKVGY